MKQVCSYSNNVCLFDVYRKLPYGYGLYPCGNKLNFEEKMESNNFAEICL